MNRVIRSAAVATAPPAFGGGRQFVDAATADLIDQARAEAFAAGRREGFEEGRAETAGAVARIDAALRDAVRCLGELRAGEINQTITVALDVAEFVVGQLPSDQATAVAARIEEALADLDDEQVTVAIHPQDWDTISHLVRLPRGVTMDRDPALHPGEARIVGRWATAELTREAALQIAREVLL